MIEEPLALVNAVASPFGAGWSLAGLRQLHPQPDGKIMMVEGGTPSVIYYPYVNFARLSEGATISSIISDGRSGDKRNLLGYHGAGAQTLGQLADIDYQDGLEFSTNTGDWDWVVADLGQARDIETLGLSFQTYDTNQAVVSVPLLQIYTSPDNENWSLWSDAYEDVIDGFTATKLSSPYLASRGSPQTVRYLKYQIRPPAYFGLTARTVLYRLLAFGPSDRYGSGRYGQDEEYPHLQRLQEGGYQQTERDGTIYRYSAEGLLQSVADVHSNTTAYTWADRLLTQVTDAAGGITALSYSGGKLGSVTDAAGRTTTFTVDANGDLTEVALPDGSHNRFGYDARHLITTHTDARDNVITYAWDATYPNLKKTTGVDGGVITMESGYFEHLLNPIAGDDATPAASPSILMESTRTDSLGRVTTYRWDPYEAASPYSPLYRLRITDAAGRITDRYMHPRMEGVEVLRVEPDGTRIKNTYDENEGRFVMKVEDKADTVGQQVLAQYTYEPNFGRIATSSDRGGHTTTYSYNDKGSLTSTADPLGNGTTMTYDTKGQLVTVTDAEAATTGYENDARGNRTKTTDALGRVTTMAYDATGNMTSLTDPAGKVTRWEYDVMGRVTKVIDPAGGETRYVYEPGPCSGGCGGGSSNLLKSITDPAGQTTSFEYDAAGHMTAVVNPLGTRKEYSYDLGGRLIRFKNGRAQEITYQYDLSNNMVKKSLPDEGDVDYTYDTNNRVTQVTDADSILRYEYATSTGGGGGSSLKGQKMKEYFGLNGDPRYDMQGSGYLQNNYWKNGSEPIEVLSQADLIVDQAGGTTRTFNFYYNSYDAAHRILNLRAEPGAGNYGAYFAMSYDRVGRRVTGQTRINRTEGPLFDDITYQHDAAGQLLQLKHAFSNGTPVERRYDYVYDAAGTRTSMTDIQGAHAFGYDERYQLTSATHPADPAESFTYDAVGNRLSSHISPTYTYDAANQLLDDSEFTYSYDADGNCTGKVSKLNGERHEYIFNSENRMTGYRKYDISSNPLASADYFYDPVGRRMAKSVDGVLTRYIYHEEDIWYELGPDGTIARSYFHGPGIDEPLGLWFGANAYMYTYMAEALGTIRDIARPYGGAPVAASFYYDSFGQIMSSSTPGWPDPYRFTAREWDGESNLFHHRSRYYDPHGGRFTSEDPIGFFAGTNFYSYVDNDPVDKVDPFGLAVENKSNCTVYVKPEDSAEAIAVKPGAKYSTRQDGVAVPASHKGEVYKSPDYVDLVVNEDGSVSPSGPISSLLNAVGESGWKDKKWLQGLQEKGDKGWDKVFGASEKKPECGEDKEESCPASKQ